jgi:hypothetical protein
MCTLLKISSLCLVISSSWSLRKRFFTFVVLGDVATSHWDGPWLQIISRPVWSGARGIFHSIMQSCIGFGKGDLNSTDFSDMLLLSRCLLRPCTSGRHEVHDRMNPLVESMSCLRIVVQESPPYESQSRPVTPPFREAKVVIFPLFVNI